MNLENISSTEPLDLSVLPSREETLAFFECTRVVPILHHDGGRSLAGFKSSDARDCVARAWSIVLEAPYREIYDELAELQQQHYARKAKRRSKHQHVYEKRAATRSANNGIAHEVTREFAKSRGFTWVPTMSVGSGTTVHVRPDELPAGRLVLKLSKHVAAFVDGLLIDNHDSARGGSRAVYGYWVAPSD